MTDSPCDPRLEPLLRTHGVRTPQDAYDFLRDIADRDIPADLAPTLARIGLESLLARLEAHPDIEASGPAPRDALAGFPLGVPFDRRGQK